MDRPAGPLLTFGMMLVIAAPPSVMPVMFVAVSNAMTIAFFKIASSVNVMLYWRGEAVLLAPVPRNVMSIGGVALKP